MTKSRYFFKKETFATLVETHRETGDACTMLTGTTDVYLPYGRILRDENGKPNCMNAAWGGMYTDNTVGVCIDISHKTTKDILKRKAFTISMATVDYVAACDYVGIVSGNNEPDKFAKAG